MQAAPAQPRKWQEVLMFFVLSVMIWPIIACGFVATYGLAFWIYCLLVGPPGSR
jgi:periplasmic nitrate reductase NapE